MTQFGMNLLFPHSFAVARGSVPISRLWQSLKVRRAQSCRVERGRLQVCPHGVCWSAKAGGRLTRTGASYLIGLGAYLTFSVGYELDMGVKKKTERLALIDQVLAVLYQLLQKLASWAGCCRGTGLHCPIWSGSCWSVSFISQWISISLRYWPHYFERT